MMPTKIGILLISLFFLIPSFAQEEQPLPDGCGNPFSPPGVFGDFFEKTIQTGVMDNGSVSQAYVQLFAVNKLRKFLSEKLPNPAEGDAIDRHLGAQICAFAKGKTNITSRSIELNKHLLSIAPKLLGDVKKLANKMQEQWSERQRAMIKYEARQGLVLKAEEMAETEVNSFLTKF